MPRVSLRLHNVVKWCGGEVVRWRGGVVAVAPAAVAAAVAVAGNGRRQR